MSDELNMPIEEQVAYTDDNIRHLSDMEHVRLRPGMYIGKLGDGTQNDDGIYVLLKEILDNSIDEFKMHAGKRIEIEVTDHKYVSVRDYGRGIPQGKLVEAVSVLNTGGKYDSKAFKKSVGLNGVGVKAVNALSAHFEASSYRDGKVRTVVFEKGNLISDNTADAGPEETGTRILFEPDNTDTTQGVCSFVQHGFDLGISLEVLEYCIGQSMKNDRPIFNYLKVMRKHADEAIRTILDALKTDDPHEPSAHENEILL